MGSPYEEIQLHPAMGAKVVEWVQRVIISGQAWGKSSKVIKPQKSLLVVIKSLATKYRHYS
jgi:hypothetical protein